MGLGQLFGRLGEYCGRNKCTAIAFCLTVTGIFSIGIINLTLETDPQNLWAPLSGRTHDEQEYFNENFGSFFRINQIIISPGPNYASPKEADAAAGSSPKGQLRGSSTCKKRPANFAVFDNEEADGEDEPTNVPNLFDLQPLKWLYYLEKIINTRSFKQSGNDVTVDALCYKPVSNKGCLITSPMDYWKMNITLLNERAAQKYLPRDQRVPPRKSLQYDALCIETNTKTTLIPCTDSNGIPVIPTAMVGGSSCETYENDNLPCEHCWIKAQALIVTYLLNKDSFTSGIAETWEKDIFEDTIFAFRNKTLDFKKYLPTETIEVDYANPDSWPDLQVEYLSERSIPDELVEETSQNIWIVGLSYSLMFIYISMAIGSFPSKTHSGFLIGFAGILIVVASILTSIGCMSFLGVGMTMISGEVIPFLILAIGVDNMFIISSAVKASRGKTIHDKVREGMTEVGPSITAAAVSEILAFFVGTFTNIPALSTFCIQAAIAVFFDYVFQITAFVAILVWDEQRKAKGLCDVLFCVRSKRK